MFVNCTQTRKHAIQWAPDPLPDIPPRDCISHGRQVRYALLVIVAMMHGKGMVCTVSMGLQGAGDTRSGLLSKPCRRGLIAYHCRFLGHLVWWTCSDLGNTPCVVCTASPLPILLYVLTHQVTWIRQAKEVSRLCVPLSCFQRHQSRLWKCRLDHKWWFRGAVCGCTLRMIDFEEGGFWNYLQMLRPFCRGPGV